MRSNEVLPLYFNKSPIFSLKSSPKHAILFSTIAKKAETIKNLDRYHCNVCAAFRSKDSAKK